MPLAVDWTLSTLENTSAQNKKVGKHRKQQEWLGMQLSWQNACLATQEEALGSVSNTAENRFSGTSL